MFSVMWSEHCSYKSSRSLLKTLPTAGEDVLAGPGENAGVVRIGDGLAVAFKLESHNHPSAVEPFQGAATGVGGILRDIVAMGARPIALLDPLKFGWPDDAATRRLVRGVVGGIGSLRQLRRRADARRRAAVRPDIHRQPAGQRHVRGPGGRERPRPRDCAARPDTSRSCTARRPAATASAARPCWPAPTSVRARRRCGRASRSAIRSRASC